MSHKAEILLFVLAYLAVIVYFFLLMLTDDNVSSTCRAPGRSICRRRPYQRLRRAPVRASRCPHLRSSGGGWGDPLGRSPACGGSSAPQQGRVLPQPTRRTGWGLRDPDKRDMIFEKLVM